MVKRLPAMWETWVQSLGQEDPLEKEMAPHSSTLAWKITWMEEPVRLQSMGCKKSGTTEWLHFHFHYILYALLPPNTSVCIFPKIGIFLMYFSIVNLTLDENMCYIVLSICSLYSNFVNWSNKVFIAFFPPQPHLRLISLLNKLEQDNQNQNSNASPPLESGPEVSEC